MQVNKELISRLEKLARLKLDSAEQTKFADDLTRILGMIDKLLEADTTGVSPLAHPTESNSGWREDRVGEQLSQEEALKNAPRQDGQFIQVPKVID